MQVALGRKGDYSVRAVLDLARHHGDGRRKAREIAAAMDIPEQYLPQILAPLIRAKLLAAVAGPDGGYSLAVPPATITLLAVIEAAEGPLRSDRCVLRGGPCDWEGACPLHEAWTDARLALAERLQDVTFDILAARDADIELGRTRQPVPHLKATARRGVRGAAGPAPAEPARRPRSSRGSTGARPPR